MNSQGMTMLVETADQYFDIFQKLKEEVTTSELRPGYYDLTTDDINLQEEDEFHYPVDSDQEGESEVVSYFTDIATPEDRKDAHDSTNTADYTIEYRSQQRDAEHTRIRSLPLF